MCFFQEWGEGVKSSFGKGVFVMIFGFLGFAFFW